MNDRETTVGELRDMVRQFVDERDWQQFHAPKNISMAMAIECAELMEHFQWLDVDQSLPQHLGEKLDDIGEELADVVCYALALSNVLQLDLSATLAAKMEKNRRKYPAEDFRGKYE